MPASQSSTTKSSTSSSASLMSGGQLEHGQCNNTVNNVVDSTSSEPDAFDAIISQLTALGSEIEQELAQSHCHNNNKNLSNKSATPSSVITNNDPGVSGGQSLVPTASFISSTQPQQQQQSEGVPTSMEKAPPSQSSMMYFPNSHSMYHHYQAPSHPSTFGTPQQQQQQQQPQHVLDMNSSSVRTDSPDNDSAFSDTISLISSEQSSSSSSSHCSTNGTNSTAVRLHATAATNNNMIRNVVGVVPTPVSCPVPPPPPSIHSSQSQTMATLVNSGSVQSNVNPTSGALLNNSSASQTSQQQQQQTQQGQNSQRELFVEQQTTTGKDNISNTDDSTLQDDHDSLASIVRQLESFVGEVQTRLYALQEVEEEEEDDDDNGNVVQQIEPSLVVEKSNETPSKEEIIQKAIERIREANFRKLYIKVFTEDNSAKSILADERMTISDICQHLAQKNHIAMDISQCIIEHMPQLYLERFFEDHESLIENILHWDRVGSTNKMFFSQRLDKYDVFYSPEKYLLTGNSTNNNNSGDNFNEKTLKKSSSLGDGSNSASAQLRADLINNFFKAGKACAVPEIEGILHLRSEGKKVWKKYFFTLRSSGLYYCLKGRPKSTKDLICLTTFEMNCLYYGIGWRKKYKAPNDFGFAIKHPQVQSKSPKQIKYLCAETEDDLRLWTTGIRIAKYGKQLLDNFEKMKYLKAQLEGNVDHLQEDMKHLMIDSNGNEDNYHHHQSLHHQQFYGYHGQYQQTSSQDQQQSSQQHATVVMRAPRISSIESMRSSCDSSSSSSGCLSEQSSVASTPSSSSNMGSHSMLPNGHDSSSINSPHQQHYMASPQSMNAFDTDYPLGTIKRKPSVSMIMQPKIPLTNTTRNLALQSDDALLEVECDESTNVGNNNGTNYSNGNVNGNNNNHEDDFGGSIYGDFQRFKAGTLSRRSNMDIKSISVTNACKSPSYHNQLTVPVMVHHQRQPSDSSDDLPPPPPPSLLMKEAESTLSLNNNSFPPPPPEVTEAVPNDAMPSPPPPPTCSSVSMSNLTGSSASLQQIPMLSQQQPSSPMQTLPSVPMTPQPQPKNSVHRLSRRLSDLSPGTANLFFNYRQQQQQNGSFDVMPPSAVLAPNSRASIAATNGGGENYHTGGFATLKAYNTNNRSLNRMQRNTIEAWNKYGTSPRIKAFEQQQQQQSILTNGGSNAVNGQNYEAFRENVYGTRNANYSFPSYGQNVGENKVDGRFGQQTNNYNNINSSTGVNQYLQHNQSFGNLPSNNISSPAVGAVQHQESHYMSISPHLLHRHQQMQQAQRQQPEMQQQPNQFFIRHHQQQQQQAQQQSPSTMPEQLFLQNMERVMQRKWNVAQMLHKEPTATPGQVLGFRDSAYLPPPPPGATGPSQQQQNGALQSQMNFGMSNGSMSMLNCNGQTSPQGLVSSMKSNNNLNYHQFMPSEYPLPPPPASSSNVFFPGTSTSPGYVSNGTPNFVASFSNNNNNTVYARSPGPKSVRIVENATIMGSSEYNPPQPMPPPSPSLSSTSSASHYSAGMLKRMPPPPPKRSNSTQLTTGAHPH